MQTEGVAKRPELFTSPDRGQELLTHYASAKSGAQDFQAAKTQLFVAFKKAQLGDWVKKPLEQDDFHLELDVESEKPKNL